MNSQHSEIYGMLVVNSAIGCIFKLVGLIQTNPKWPNTHSSSMNRRSLHICIATAYSDTNVHSKVSQHHQIRSQPYKNNSVANCVLVFVAKLATCTFLY